MGDKQSEKYVVELLKQLEELKRKKALKEKKLQKLKKVNTEGTKGQSSKVLGRSNSCSVSEAHSNKSCNVRNSSTSANEFKKDENHFSKCTTNDDLQNNKVQDENQTLNNIEGTKSQPSKILGHSNSYSVSEAHPDNSCNVRNSSTSANEFNKDNHFSSASKCFTEDSLQNENQSLNSQQLESNNDAVILNAQQLNEITTARKNIESSSVTTLKDECLMGNSVCVKSDFLELRSNLSQNHHKNDSLCHDNDNNVNFGKTEKSNVDAYVEHLSESIQDVKEPYSENKANVSSNVILRDEEIKSAPLPVIEKESFVLESTDCTNHKIVDNLKEISSCKRKSPDILDESLNSNMSCFLSSDLFSAVDDKKESSEEKKSPGVFTEKSIPVENIDTNTLVPSLPSPIIPISVMGEKKRSNTENFNFPKFSTPTSGIFLSSSSENPANGVEENFGIPNGIKTSSQKAEDTCASMKKAHEDGDHLVFNTSHISSILGKGLASVLDAHYESPKKSTSNEKRHCQEKSVDSAHKRRKLFSEPDGSPRQQSETGTNIKYCNLLKDISEDSKDADKNDTDGFDFDNIGPLHSDSFGDVQKFPTKNLSEDIQPEISKNMEEMVRKETENAGTTECLDLTRIDDENPNDDLNKSVKNDSELLVVPETEGLFLSKDEDFLQSLALSQHFNDCGVKDNFLNASSQSRLESPVVNQIVAAVKKSVQNSNFPGHSIQSKAGARCSVDSPEQPLVDNVTKPPDSPFENSLDTSYLEDGSQMLGNYKHIPFICEENIQKSKTSDESEVESNLSFICSLGGASNEAVIDVEMVAFNDSIYAFIQQKTQIHVWRQEKKREWFKIFNHQVEDMLSLEKMCVTKDDDNLIVVLLLSTDEQYCLQFLLFEKDAIIIKLMENTHWLEDRCTNDCVLLCGLEGLMFATAQVKEGHEVSLHAFISLKDSPRLMTAVLGLTDNVLCSLCNIENIPNAMLGISESVLYVWHILEARLVTSVSLHPCSYLPIQQCFWSTIENGLIFMLTTCKRENKHQVCQLLVANLATGFCQVVMTYSTQPSDCKVTEITKAVYREPFIVVSHLNGALLWSVSEAPCCAALLSKSDVTSVAISKDFENWGLITVGSKRGYITCYGLKA